jgi:hypothetical protein
MKILNSLEWGGEKKKELSEVFAPNLGPEHQPLE